MSVGVVFDQRLVDWPEEGGSVGERLKAFLIKHPVARELLADAEFQQDDVHWRRNLAYYSTTFAGDGFVLVGDAAAFMDPFYSPGMDWISYTTSRAAHLITAQRSGECMETAVALHNRDLALSHRSWFEALYKDKYEYMGEWDLMSLAFRLDLGLYYLCIVSQPFRLGPTALLTLPFSQPISRPFFHLIRTYNRRFAQIARRRREINALGKTNRGNRCLIPGYTMGAGDAWVIGKALARWAWLELSEGWHTWWDRSASSLHVVPEPSAAPCEPSVLSTIPS